MNRWPLRKEDLPLLTGGGTFVGDLHLPGMAHAAVVRSPYAHARVRSVAPGRALDLPGVIDVVAAADLPAECPPIPVRQFGLPGMERFLQRPLATGRVRYVGEPVAVVLARSRYAAEDGAELVEVEYEELEPVLDPELAMEAGAPLLFEAAATNLAGSLVMDHGDVSAALRAADLVVEETFFCHRHAAVPLETRGLVAEPGQGGRLTVWGTAKIPHVNRGILARLLGWPEARIRMVELDVGGGFGGRGEFYPEDYLIPLCALRLGAPVSWIEDRSEHLRASNHSREQVHHVAVGLRRDGTVLGLRDRLVSNAGAYIRTHGMTVPGMSAALLPGPYRWPAYRCEVAHLVTNKTPAGTYRAPGRYEANFARERVMDIAARRLGMDPIELRRRNLIGPRQMPYETRTHTDGHPVVYEAGDYPLLLDKALDHPRFGELARWRRGPARPGRRRGLGYAFFVEKSGIGVREYARVAIDACGRVRVRSGTASVGQGVHTVLAQVCAEHLGVDYDNVSVSRCDTDQVPEGMGAFGSRASMLGGSAVMLAARGLRRRLLEGAAEALEASPDDLELAGDRLVVRGAPGRGIALGELVGAAGELGEEARFASTDMAFPYGLHCAAVEVDVESGAVWLRGYGVAYDVGRAINPTLVQGQIVGGVAQGLGGALLEELAYDRSGQPLATSLVDYLLPGAMEVPEVDVMVTEDSPCPLNPLGVRGAGEAGVAGVGAAVANAVSDALGREVTRLPLAPDRVRALARETIG